MWWILNTLVGSKIGKTVGLVLAVTLILFGTIQYIRWQERDKVLLEVQKEDLKNYKDTRERIDEVINHVLDYDGALHWLRSRGDN
jgi:hypothetical protein